MNPLTTVILAEIDHSEATRLSIQQKLWYEWMSFCVRVSLSNNAPAGRQLGNGHRHYDMRVRAYIHTSGHCQDNLVT